MLAVSTLEGPMSGCFQNDFSVEMNVGGQLFQAILDTGSSTTAVAGMTCADCNVTPSYTASPEQCVQGSHSTLNYGSGASVSGPLYADVIAVAGSTSVSTRFMVITQQNQFFRPSVCGSGSTGPTSQAILGMAYPNLAAAGTDSWFYNFMAVNPSVEPVFSLYYCGLDQGSFIIGSPFEFMTHDSPLMYTPVDEQRYYSVTLNSIWVAGTDSGYTTGDFGQTIVDSGTSLLLLPPAVYNTVSNMIVDSSGWQDVFGSTNNDFFTSFNCFSASSSFDPSTINSVLPPLKLQLANSTELLLAALGSYVLEWAVNDILYLCPGIGSSGQATSTVLGYPVISQFYTIFDWGTTPNRVGFLSVQHVTSNLTSMCQAGNGSSSVNNSSSPASPMAVPPPAQSVASLWSQIVRWLKQTFQGVILYVACSVAGGCALLSIGYMLWYRFHRQPHPAAPSDAPPEYDSLAE